VVDRVRLSVITRGALQVAYLTILLASLPEHALTTHVKNQQAHLAQRMRLQTELICGPFTYTSSH
jgi:hypothetical protein